MAHTSDYSEIYATPGDGLNDWEIAAAVGRSVRDIGQLCGDERYDSGNDTWVRVNATNKWARKKPVRSTKRDPLTDNDRKAANFGFDLAAIRAYTPQGALANAVTYNGAWPYVTPRGPVYSEWYRELDFDGYHRNAIPAFEVFVSAFANERVKRITVEIDDFGFEGAEIRLDELEGLSSLTNSLGKSIGQWRLGAIARRGNDNPYVVYCPRTLSESFVDPDGEGGVEGLAIDVNALGTYTVCAFITDYDPSNVDPDAAYQYIFIDGQFDAHGDFNGDIPVVVPVTYQDFEPFNFMFAKTENAYGNLQTLRVTGEFEIHNGRTDEPDVTMYAELFYYDSAGEAWTPMHASWPHGSNSMISSGDQVDVNFSGIGYPASALKIGIYYTYPSSAYPYADVRVYVNPITGALSTTGQPTDYLQPLDQVIESWAESDEA